MDLEKVLADSNQRKSDIEQKYKVISEKIKKLQHDIEQIPIKYSNRTKQYQAEQRLVLEAKINELERKLTSWMDNQQKKAESKLKEFQDKIIDQANTYANNLLNSKNNFVS